MHPAKDRADNKQLPRLQRDGHAFKCPFPFGVGQQLNKFGGLFSPIFIEPVLKPCRLFLTQVIQMPPAGIFDMAACDNLAAHDITGILAGRIDIGVRFTAHDEIILMKGLSVLALPAAPIRR